MRKVYQYTHQVNGESKLEIIKLSSKKKCDFVEILHRVALEICMSPQGRELCKDISELTFGELMEIITPEMLAPYDLIMERLRDSAEQMDNAPPVVSRCEMELYREFCDRYNQRLRDLKDYAESIARQLETLRLSGHTAISTWAAEIIPERSISWAYQYVTGKECAFQTFIERKIKEAKPHGATEGAGRVKLGDCFININAKARDYEP